MISKQAREAADARARAVLGITKQAAPVYLMPMTKAFTPAQKAAAAREHLKNYTTCSCGRRSSHAWDVSGGDGRHFVAMCDHCWSHSPGRLREMRRILKGG
jgi:hypothetical protein